MIITEKKVLNNSWWILTQTTLIALLELYVYATINDYGLNSLIALCWTANFVFVIEIVLLYWKRGRLLDQIVIYATIVFLFTFGQCILYSLGVVPNRFNVIEYTSIESLIRAIKFALPAYIMFVFGCAMGANRGISKNYECNEVGFIDEKAESFSYIFIAIGLIPFLLTIANNISAVYKGGYNYYYGNGVRLSNYISFFSYYFYVGLFLLSGHKKESVRKKCFFILIAIVVVYSLCGDRGTALSLMISVYLLYRHYGVKKQFSSPIIISALIVLGLASVSIIENWRMSIGKGVDITNLLINSLAGNNVLYSTLSNLGGTIYALAKVIILIPFTHDYIFGGSYLASLVLLIPSPFRLGILGVIDNMDIYSSPASWLMKSLGLTYGPGFTPFAEAYLNFGIWGIPFMFILGFFFAKLFSAKYDEQHNTTYGFQLFTFFILAMSARGSFNFVFAFWIRYTVIPLICIKFVKLNKRIRLK